MPVHSISYTKRIRIVKFVQRLTVYNSYVTLIYNGSNRPIRFFRPTNVVICTLFSFFINNALFTLFIIQIYVIHIYDTNIYMLTYIYTYVYKCICIYVHTYINKYIHTFIHTYIHTFIHTFTHIHTYTHTYTYIHAYTCAYILYIANTCT